MTRIKGVTIGKSSRVKLTYTKEWLADISSVGDPPVETWLNVSQPSGPRTYPVVAQNASIVFLGSHFCTPLGNATAGINEDYPSGLVDWSSFYDEAICFGSSISIQAMFSNPTAVTLFRYVLLPIATKNYLDLQSPNSPAATTRAQLDALDYGDISSYPGARSGYIRPSASGVSRVKMFRKTKHMLGLKDVIDSQTDLSMTLPKAASLNIGDNTQGLGQGWLWYYRIFAYEAGTVSNLLFTVRINYYAQLCTRGLILQETANSA